MIVEGPHLVLNVVGTAVQPDACVSISTLKGQIMYLASNTFTVPGNVTQFEVEVFGGGGGGAGGSALGILTVTPGQVIPFVVGGPGGTTTFQTLSATGGANAFWGGGPRAFGGGGGMGSGQVSRRINKVVPSIRHVYLPKAIEHKGPHLEPKSAVNYFTLAILNYQNLV